MPRTDDPTLSIPNMRAEFKSANPEVFAKAQGDLDTTRRLGAIETRTEAIKQRFYQHFERHEDVWVAAEAIRLAASRDFPTLQHPAPRVFGAQPSRKPNFAELMMTKAKQNVHARAIRRLTSINSIKANLQNALIRNRPQVTQVQSRTPANDTARKQGLRNSGP
jgi:hypothetical protein